MIAKEFRDCVWRVYPSFLLTAQEALTLDAFMGALTAVQLQRQIHLAAPTTPLVAAKEADRVEDILST